MSKRDRAWRRNQVERVQSNRAEKWKHITWSTSTKRYVSYDARSLGKLKKNNWSCGCGMCKPWKHGFDHEYRVSELRKLGKIRKVK